MLTPLSFSAGFYDLKVLYFGETGLSLFTIFAIAYTPIIILNKFFSASRHIQKKLNIFLLIFILYLIISKLFPFFAGPVMVLPYTSEYLDLSYEPLKESIFGIRNLFFPVLYGLTAIAISIQVKTYRQLLNCTSSFIWGLLMIGFIGLIFQILTIVNYEMSINLIAYLTYGNTFTDEIVARIDYQSFFGLKRMYTFAGEPGFSANLFVFGLGIILVIKNIGENNSKSFLYHSNIPPLFLFIASIMTLSTTGILGILITIFIIIFWASSNKIKSFLFILFFSILILLVLVIFDDLRNYLIQNHLLKLIGGAGSGAIRFVNLQHSIDLFMTNPLIGIGYGGHRSTTLIFSLLVNLGLIGTLIFFMMILNIIFGNKNVILNQAVPMGLSTALLVWIILSPISQTGVALLFPWLWLVIGLLMSYPSRN